MAAMAAMEGGRKMSKTKVTVSGYAGTGKSSVCKALAERLGYPFLSVGNFTREFAKQRFNLSINAFQQKCRQEPNLDDEINFGFRDKCNELERVVADFRLGFHFVRDALHVFLKVSEEEAAKRIGGNAASREMELTDVNSIRERNTEMRHRFIERFGVDFSDESNYGLVIDTTETTVEQVGELILEAMEKSG
jgi:cytidylate kinase